MIIKHIDTSIRLSIFSLMNTHERMGTNTYPRDSSTGMSFRFTPLLIAVMFKSSEPKKMAYASITLQLSIDASHDLCVLSALFFRRI